VYPIVGGRKLEHLKGNIEALKIELTDAEVDEIDDSAPFDIGFPMKMLFGFWDDDFKYRSRMTTSDVSLLGQGGPVLVPQKQRPIRPDF
jgi:hypothetical protein